MSACPVCGGGLEEDPAVNEKWRCKACGRVLVVIAKRDAQASGGEHDG